MYIFLKKQWSYNVIQEKMGHWFYSESINFFYFSALIHIGFSCPTCIAFEF